MNSFSTISLIVFCALLSSGVSHKCHQCMTLNSKTCEMNETECIGNRCMTVSQYFNDNGNVFNSMYKGCANESMCDKEGIVTGKYITFMGRINCCTGERCNKDKFQLPEENNTENGIKCPLCYYRGSTEDCQPVEWKSCTGAENHCFNYRGKMSIPDQTVGNYSLKGCSNSIACLCNFNVAIGITEIDRVFLGCDKQEPSKE